MKHYHNTMEKVLDDVREKIAQQNLNLDLYGCHSIEFQTARIILNVTLETLVNSNYILDYDFSFFDNKIKEIEFVLGSSHKVFISDVDYEIY